MKIIEALKSIKDLKRKADDIKLKISEYCADKDCETPTYPDQKKQISEWLQSHTDIIKNIAHLKVAILRTNVLTDVSIQLGGKTVTKSISYWIERRRDLARHEELAWRNLTDKGIRETYTSQITPNSPVNVVKRRLYFDPIERDRNVELFRSEPMAIDASLEIANAVTDLIES